MEFRTIAVSFSFLMLTFGCAETNDDFDGVELTEQTLVATGTPDGVGVVRLLNDPATDFERLDITARLDKRSAAGLIHHRNGPDGIYGTWDDAPFESIEEVDAVKWVGKGALLRLLTFAGKEGYVPEGDDLLGVYDRVPVSVLQSYALLDLVNGATFVQLDDDFRLNARAARAILTARPYATVADLAATRYVGRSTIGRLLTQSEKK